eukprot:TRINITY_DN10308_c0_g1_i1.p1 TRINITY_DN10308_c0_g1~~TRINITY_DN10308_c0_g1_i1.p1  ORF type:complete len:258 (+),score=65.47 TRINITY_DN10308_c0_g1_i1:22-795(+)
MLMRCVKPKRKFLRHNRATLTKSHNKITLCQNVTFLKMNVGNNHVSSRFYSNDEPEPPIDEDLNIEELIDEEEKEKDKDIDDNLGELFNNQDDATDIPEGSYAEKIYKEFGVKVTEEIAKMAYEEFGMIDMDEAEKVRTTSTVLPEVPLGVSTLTVESQEKALQIVEEMHKLREPAEFVPQGLFKKHFSRGCEVHLKSFNLIDPLENRAYKELTLEETIKAKKKKRKKRKTLYYELRKDYRPLPPQYSYGIPGELDR